MLRMQKYMCICRVLALSTLAAVGATWLTHRRMPLPVGSRRWLNGLMAVTAAQVWLVHTFLLASTVCVHDDMTLPGVK